MDIPGFAVAEEKTGLNAGDTPANLLPALQHLDRLIKRAVIAAEAAYGSPASNDLYRGLYISPEVVTQLLDRKPGIHLLRNNVNDPDLADALPESLTDPESQLAWLAHTYNKY